MVYNIYLNSPQLAYNANKKKYYINIIKLNNKIFNSKFKPYKPSYFITSYDKIFNPNNVSIPD
jgi:hypothetical protein